MSAADREYAARPAVKARRKVYDRDYYAQNKERRRAQMRATHLKSRYGISGEEWDALFARQEKCCAICFSETPRAKVGWHTDHDHLTGRVRGILCQPCNVALGQSMENVEVLRRMIEYLERGV